MASHLLRARLGKVCVALTGDTPADLLRRAEAALRDTNFVELRLDSLASPRTAVEPLGMWLREQSAVTAIATCRRTENGGSFSGSVAEQVEVLRAAAGGGFQLLDVEIETAEALPETSLAELRERRSGAGAQLPRFPSNTAAA